MCRPVSATWLCAGSSSETKVQQSMTIAKRRPLLLGLTGLTILSLLVAAFAFARVQTTHAASGGFTRTISSGGTSSFSSAGPASGGGVGVQDPEFANGGEGDSADAGGGGGDQGVNRSHTGATKGNGRAVSSKAATKSNPELGVHFQGLNFH